MNEIQNIFQRFEIKYLISEVQRKTIEAALQAYMMPDAFGESVICNVYFDTPDDRIIRRSMEGSVYKEKLRLRSYGTAAPDDRIFCELKKKYQGVVYKRRLLLPDGFVESRMKKGCFALDHSQIGREIERFGVFYRGLRPAMYLSYDRAAYFCREDARLRITFDRNILWRQEELTLASKPYGTPILKHKTSLMEVKTPVALPLWLTGLLSEHAIYKTSFSKYANAYLNARKQEAEGGFRCA